MITIPGVHPFFMWAGFILLVIIFLVLDLGVFNKKKHTLSIKEAVIWSLVWFGTAMLFNYFLWLEFGKEIGLQFLTGYILEKSLSVDNLFVILLIFLSFKVDTKYQHKILFWGIVGALIMRGLMIWIGSVLISRFEWILMLFGLFLIYGGYKIIFKEEGEYDPHDSWIVKMLHKFVHVTRARKGGAFFMRHKGQFMVTIYFVALLVIEVTDLAFALDSIPAIFGITKEPFIVFTSNIFAILGLRSLYFVILKAHQYFSHLNIGLGIILIFIGAKMLLEKWIHVSIVVSLAIVIGVLIISMVSSILTAPAHLKEDRARKRKGRA